ncbi:MAG TPA: GNAT family N-acetyltransferase [Anaerolineales bacterium]|nr:GNAT family N-acetyltransferase [Anaerolineales bacterium]
MKPTLLFTIRRAEPGDYEAFHKILSGPKAIWGTLQLPFASPELWRKRLAEPPEGLYYLLACIEGDAVGEVTLQTFPNAPRRRHVGTIFMAVRDDWQGKGAGTALMQAAVDLADKWLNIARLELEVYTDNEPAIRLYKKFEFELEGTRKMFAFRAGEYVDVYSMARIKMNQ